MFLMVIAYHFGICFFCIMLVNGIFEKIREIEEKKEKNKGE
jgi:Mg2+/citrate symporter